jgi:hypothetical protein
MEFNFDDPNGTLVKWKSLEKMSFQTSLYRGKHFPSRRKLVQTKLIRAFVVRDG